MKSDTRGDVRMRGFAARALVKDALEWIDAQTAPLDSEPVAYDAACRRVLAADVTAGIDVPSFDRAAMDGYAVRAEQTEGAGDYNPLGFDVVGEALPGRAFEKTVGPAQAVRIMTGAPMPPGANAVVPAEYAAESAGRVEVTAAVSPGKHLGRRGEDVKAGDRILAAGRRLRPQDVGLLASIGISQVEVVRKPAVRVVVTGTELVQPGEPRGPYQIFESNSAMLRGLIERDGGLLESVHRVEDDRTAIRQALLAPGADVVLISGASSVGTEDHAPSLLAEEGELAVHGVAMRPSSPAGMGRLGSTLVFLLPGNPVSCLCAYDFFAGRAIRRLAGLSADWPYRTIEARAAQKIVSAVGRVDYCRVRIVQQKTHLATSVPQPGGVLVEPVALSGASILSSTTRADGFVVVPAEREGYAPGSAVTAYLYDPL